MTVKLPAADLQRVRTFLQSVVVVDDRAFSGKVADARPEGDSAPVEVPHRGVQTGLRDPENEVPGQHDLDAKRISEAFARRGLVCGLLAPASGETLADEFVESARRADLVVLDWVLDRDDGLAALGLLGRMLDDDMSEGGARLRAIAVYTGERTLENIAARVAALLSTRYGEFPLEIDADGMAMSKGPVRVAVFAKEKVPAFGTDLDDRKVSLELLPDRLTEEFAQLTQGLITGLGLASIAALRSDTHRLLRTLGREADAAYVGHRTALPRATDAEDHALDLVGAEIRAVLEDYSVKDHIDTATVLAWLARFEKSQANALGHLVNDEPWLPQVVKEGLVDGLGDDDRLKALAITHGTSQRKLQKVRQSATSLFAESSTHAEQADIRFANQLFLRTTYDRSPRTLQLGTVVRSKTGSYLLCVQPVCDCVRLPQEVRAFPFVELLVSDQNKFQFSVEDHTAERVFLRLDKRPRSISSVRFKPTGGESTIEPSVPRGGKLGYRATNHERYQWIAQLKPDIAQKAVTDLASELSRVGVNESETRRLA